MKLGEAKSRLINGMVYGDCCVNVSRAIFFMSETRFLDLDLDLSKQSQT